MQRPIIAAFGITLAISSAALWAASGDSSSRVPMEQRERGTSAEAATDWPESTMAESESTAAFIARDDVVELRSSDRMIDRTEQRTPYYDPRLPQNGQVIDRGLFNRTGPNDFGQ